jgi:hypothetical protein
MPPPYDGFPTVKSFDATVTISNGPSAFAETTDATFSDPNDFPDRIPCNNPRCTGGGSLEGRSMRVMVRAKKTSAGDMSKCRGDVTVIRNKKRPCDRFLEAKITIEYVPDSIK